MENTKTVLNLRSGLRAGHLIAILERMLRIEISSELATIGITFQHFLALLAIYNRGPVSNAELARILMITPQSTNEAVKYMHSKQWISYRKDPNHKRIRLISITTKGSQVLQKADELSVKIEERMLAGHSLEEQKQLLQQLTSCLAALGFASPEIKVKTI